ncbi:MAG TPA: MFS transporter [Pyrinomonadaceae bacterium]|nr:MFS transporter [Pyrinomonadaceae bacterium]
MSSTEANTPDQAKNPGRFYYGWIIVGTCFFILTLTSLVATSFPIFYVPVLEGFNWSRGSTAIALSIHLILSGIAAPFAGGLIDRYGPRLIMPIGAIMTGIALILLSRSMALWQVYATFGVLGALGCSAVHITPLTAVASNWFTRNRGMAISLVVAGPGAGQLFILPLLQGLIQRTGWRNTYLVFGIAVLVIPTLLVRLFLYRKPSDKGLALEEETRPQPAVSNIEEGSEETKHGGTTREFVVVDKQWAETDWTIAKAVRTQRFWMLILVLALVASGFFLIGIHLIAYLEDKGYSPQIAAYVMGFQGFINIFGTLLGGMLGDRIGREKTLSLGVLFYIGCIVFLNLSGSVVSLPLLVGFVLFYGVGYGMAFPALMASVADLFQGKHFGSILGVLLLGGYFGAAFGSWLGGFLFDWTHAYRLNFFAAGTVMLLAAALIWKAGPRQVRRVMNLPAAGTLMTDISSQA